MLAGLESAKSGLLHYCGEKITECSPSITVLGIGNLLLRDEGIGIHLVQRLADQVDAKTVNVIDGGTTPDILSLVDSTVDKLIIVDAAVLGGKPGTIYRFHTGDLDSSSSAPVSLHELGIVDSLKLMNAFGTYPKEVTILGVEPKVIDYGLELSPELEEAMPRLMELIMKEIKETNISMEVAR
jgi:hydrogenase maturation protease